MLSSLVLPAHGHPSKQGVGYGPYVAKGSSLTKCLYLIGIWQGLDLRKDTKQDGFYEIDLCA